MVTTMAVTQDCANIQEHWGVYRRPHSKTSTTLHPSPIQVPRGGLTTLPPSAAQVAINEANAIFTHRPTPHPQTTSPLQHQDDRNPQMKEDLAEYYLGKSDVEVLLNTESLEEADPLAEELENTVDMGQLPFPGPCPSFIPQPSPSPQVAHLPPHIPPKGPPLSPPNPVQQLVQALMVIRQNIHQPLPAPAPQTNSQAHVCPPYTFDQLN